MCNGVRGSAPILSASAIPDRTAWPTNSRRAGRHQPSGPSQPQQQTTQEGTACTAELSPLICSPRTARMSMRKNSTNLVPARRGMIRPGSYPVPLPRFAQVGMGQDRPTAAYRTPEIRKTAHDIRHAGRNGENPAHREVPNGMRRTECGRNTARMVHSVLGT